ATVRATFSSTEQFYEATTDGEGKFVLRNLSPGMYEVRATASGFANTVVTSVLVSKSNILTLNINLQPGATTAMVTVTDTSNQVETSSSQVSGQQISNFPIGRTI